MNYIVCFFLLPINLLKNVILIDDTRQWTRWQAYQIIIHETYSHLKYNSYHTHELYKLVWFAFALVPCVYICLYSCTLCDALVPCLMFEPHILSTLPLPACGYNMIVSELTFCTLSKGKLVRVTGKFPGKQKTKFKMENSNFTQDRMMYYQRSSRS